MNTEVLQGAPEGSSADQQHHMGIAFSPGRSRHSTLMTQEVDLEAARDGSKFSSRERVGVDGLDMAESGNSKERITEKAEV